MIRTRLFQLILATGLAAVPTAVLADTACPAAVTDAAKKAFTGATITKCVAEKSIFEVVMQKADKTRVELDISASGHIEQIEEVVPVASLPPAVTKAFAAKYAKASPLKAEKQTKADKSVTFEVAFKVGKGMKEATFKEDGTFVEEE